MATFRHIDIGLKPDLNNSGTTTYQTLWMGVPVATLAGENFCGRMRGSIMGNPGLDELIAESEKIIFVPLCAWPKRAPAC